MYHPIPSNWLAASCLVKVQHRNGSSTKNGNGSGFGWQSPEGLLFFVTNRHVVDLEYSNPKYIGYKITELEVVSPSTISSNGPTPLEVSGILVPKDRSIDIAIVPMIIQNQLEAGFSNKEYIFGGHASVETLADKSFLEGPLEWGAQVTFASYQPWRDENSEQPIVRTGILSSNPKVEYHSAEIDRNGIFLLEALSFKGSSGSPVFANACGIRVGDGLSGGNFRPAKIIGIMAGHLQNSGDGDTDFSNKLHTGLSYCHRSDLLLDLLLDQKNGALIKLHS